MRKGIVLHGQCGFTPPACRGTKRAFDLTLALLYLALLSPVFSLIALAVKWSSKGPVFSRRECLGQSPRPFDAITFRTMAADASGITGVGKVLRKSGLEELPHLINIARGEMGFVGPRPVGKHLAETLVRRGPGHRSRFAARPGMTG